MLAASGHPAEAQAARERALALFPQKGNRASAARAQMLDGAAVTSSASTA